MTVQELTQRMLNEFTRLSGYHVAEGSEFYLKTAVYAAQMAALYDHLDWITRQSFPQTAEGPVLDRHAALRGIERLSGARATGQVTFGRAAPGTDDLPVPAGTICLTEGMVRFETLTDGAILAGELQVTVPARAVLPGIQGNVLTGRVSLMSLPPVGCAWCRNPEPMTGGQEEESDGALRARILQSYARLPNGANAAYYEREALLVPGVAAVNVWPRVNGRGTVGVVVAPEDGVPEEELLARVAGHLEVKREIAVDVVALAPTVQPVTLTVDIRPRGAFEDGRLAAATALRGHFGGVLLGRGLRRNDLEHLLYNVPEVESYRILSPTDDLPPALGVLPVAETVTITEMEN